MRLFRRQERGQSLVLLAIWAVTIFILMGVGIDSGLLYTERRHLQNISDAACLAAATDLVMSKDSTTATATANTYITNNLSANDSLELDQANLQRNIVINGTDIRVSLSGPAATTFLRVGGINTYNVGAHTHCDASHGGGVVPVAVVRFPGFNSALTKRLGGGDTTLTLPQGGGTGNGKGKGNGGGKQGFMTVLDVLQGGDGILNNGSTAADPMPSTSCGTATDKSRNWYDWNAGPHNNYTVTPHTGSYRTCGSPNDATTGNPGPEVAMAGKGAQPNIGTPSFVGPVVLDARQIGTTPVYYNSLIGNGTSLNAWKATVFSYIYNQYPGPDVQIGDQLGIINGISAGQLMGAMNNRFRVGDTVTTLVYDGTVHRLGGDFQMSLDCTTDPNCSGSYVTRSPEPAAASLLNNSCKIDPQWFIFDPTAIPAPPLAAPLPGTTNGQPFQGNFLPAKYVVHLVNGGTPETIRLTARVSDANPGDGSAFGNTKIRWTVSGGTPTSWQVPSVSAYLDATLAANASTNVTVEVVQTNTTTVVCSKTGAPYTVPVQVGGAQTIQVSGVSTAQSIMHSVYGSVGMGADSSGRIAGDYFLSFVNEPAAVVQGASTMDLLLQLVDSNSTATPPAEYTCSSAGGTVDCTGASTTIAVSGPSSTGLPTSGGASPTGIAASIIADPSGAPDLHLNLDGTASVGWYTIDVQWNSPSPVHSSRFLLYVADVGNPSVKSWIDVVCYGRFKLTYMSSNGFGGQAVSGCLDPANAATPLLETSRILPW